MWNSIIYPAKRLKKKNVLRSVLKLEIAKLWALNDVESIQFELKKKYEDNLRQRVSAILQNWILQKHFGYIIYSIILIQIQIFSIFESMPSFADFVVSLWFLFCLSNKELILLLLIHMFFSATWCKIIKGEQCYLFIANIFLFSGCLDS